MMYPEINGWFLMGPIFNALSLGIGLVALFFLIETGRLDAYIDKYVDPYQARMIYRGIRIISAIIHWNILILLLYYGYQLDYNIFCEAPSKLEEHTAKPGFFSRLFRWPPFSKNDKSLTDDAKTIADREIAVAGLLWWYMVAKLLEQVEQVIGPMSSIDIKHSDVAHHIGMTYFAWIGLKQAPGGSTAIMEGINCVYLSFAYTHASVRSFYPDLLSDDVWDISKSVLSYTKNIHFAVTLLHCFSILLHSKCGYPKGLSAMIFIAVIALLISSLFTGSPYGGDVFVKQPETAVGRQAKKKVIPVNNKNKRRGKNNSNNESDDEVNDISNHENNNENDINDDSDSDPGNFFLDRLEGCGTFDELVSAFIEHKQNHRGIAYISTGRSFP